MEIKNRKLNLTLVIILLITIGRTEKAIEYQSVRSGFIDSLSERNNRKSTKGKVETVLEIDNKSSSVGLYRSSKEDIILWIKRNNLNK